MILILILIGAFVFSSSFHSNNRETKLLDVLINRKVLLYGKVSSIEYFDIDKIQFELQTDSLLYRTYKFPVDKNFLVNLDLKESSFSLNYFDKIISPGNTIRIFGKLVKPPAPTFLGDFDVQLYLKSKNIDYILQSTNYDELNLIKENNSILNFKRYLSKLRQGIKFQIEKNFETIEAAYIKGLFIAERSDIPEEVKNNFVNSGVIHVLAVSGLHTGYIVLILLALFGRLKLKIKIILVSIGLFVFAHIANLSPSVIRASLMSVIVLLNLMIERKTFLLNSISIAGLIILIIHPLDILNPSFQLSFSAVLSIALIYPFLNEYFKKLNLTGLKKSLLDLVLISIAVSIGTFPFVASYYQKFSIVSLLANLIVIPLTGFILGGIILNLFVLNIFPTLFPIYKIVLVKLIDFNFYVVNFFGNLPFAYVTIKNFSLINSIAYYLIVISVLMIAKSKFKSELKFAVITIIVFNYIYHYDTLDKNLLDHRKDYLMLFKMNNSNAIFLTSAQKNFLKLFERSDSLLKVKNDLNKLNQLIENFGINRIDYASFTSNSIFLRNDLSLKLDRMNIKRLEEKIWFAGKFEEEMSEPFFSNNMKYSFSPNSLSEIIQLKNFYLIITPLQFDKVSQKLMIRNFDFIWIKPKLDTLFVRIKNDPIISIPISFENQRMKIFEINTSGLTEIKW